MPEGIRGCLGCNFVSETAQVELKSGRVQAPAVNACATRVGRLLRLLYPPLHTRPNNTPTASKFTTSAGAAATDVPAPSPASPAAAAAEAEEEAQALRACKRRTRSSKMSVGLDSSSCTSRQGLTLVHFSAQPEPFLTLKTSPERVDTPSTSAINTS